MTHCWNTIVTWCLFTYYLVAISRVSIKSSTSTKFLAICVTCRQEHAETLKRECVWVRSTSEESLSDRSYVYMGCFTEKENSRAMPIEIGNYRDLTDPISRCAIYARRRGYIAFGVQNDGHCWSGAQAHDTYAKHGYSSNCRDGIGGVGSHAVYRLEIDYVYAGCFRDAPNRAMPSLVGTFRLQQRIQKCANVARLLGYKAFGLQNDGRECWSGATAHQTYATYNYETNCINGLGSASSNAVYLFSSVDNSRCDKPLGMEDGRIPDTSIGSSSDFHYIHRAANGRLNFVATATRSGAWVAESNDKQQWLQVDFNHTSTITRVSTQGRMDFPHWVKRYTLSYSQDGVFRFVPFNNNKEFTGNEDQNTIKMNFIDPWIKAKSVRLHPTAWSGRIALRAEFYGCAAADPIPQPKCMSALGMENGEIQDNHINASSFLNNSHRPSNARLHFKATSNRTGGWSAKTNDDKQYLQVEFAKVSNITGIATQGREDVGQWVTSYTLSYGLNGTSFTPYGFSENTTRFSGNNNRNTARSHELAVPIVARYIRVHPVEWHNHITMRVEFYGCYQPEGDFVPVTTQPSQPLQPPTTSTIYTTTTTDAVLNKTKAFSPTIPAAIKETVKGDFRMDIFPYLCAAAVLLLLLSVLFVFMFIRVRRRSRSIKPRNFFVTASQEDHRRQEQQREVDHSDGCYIDPYLIPQDILTISHNVSGAYQPLNFGPINSTSANINKAEPSYDNLNKEVNTDDYLVIIP